MTSRSTCGAHGWRDHGSGERLGIDAADGADGAAGNESVADRAQHNVWVRAAVAMAPVMHGSNCPGSRSAAVQSSTISKRCILPKRESRD